MVIVYDGLLIEDISDNKERYSNLSIPRFALIIIMQRYIYRWL